MKFKSVFHSLLDSCYIAKIEEFQDNEKFNLMSILKLLQSFLIRFDRIIVMKRFHENQGRSIIG